MSDHDFRTVEAVYENYELQEAYQRGRADRDKEFLGGEPDGYVVYRNWNEQIIGKEKIHKNIFLAWASINPYHYQEEVKEMLVENGWEVHSVKIIKMEKV